MYHNKIYGHYLWWYLHGILCWVLNIHHRVDKYHCLFLQLQPKDVCFGCKISLLWVDNIELILFMQLQVSFTVFLLNILCIWWSLGKCFDSSFRNVFLILVLTFFEYGGLNHIMCHFVLRFWFSSLFFGAGITNCNVSLKLLSCNVSL